jgi:uncharacterized protein GlcG (DUF336 family)
MYVADSKRLTHAAKKIDTAIAKARRAGIAISVAVADAGAIHRARAMDGGRFHSPLAPKAVCAASNRRPTSSHGAQGQALDVAHALGLALAAGPERWTAMEGGCPIFIEGECIGGVGVSGGDWATDVRIASEAVESIGATSK